MTSWRSMTILAFGTGMFLMVPTQPAQALLGFNLSKWFGGDKVQAKAKIRTESQKVSSFKIQQAHAADLVVPLQHYLDTINSKGSIVLDESGNALIATDEPEILLRLEALIKTMDQPYNNANPMARQMLASQQMMKAIRGMAPITASSSSPMASTGRGSLSVAPLTSQPTAPAAPWMPYQGHTDIQMSTKILEERPPLGGFQLVGWIDDANGMVVVLRNSGQRYIFHRGRILYNSLASKDYVKGYTATIKGKRLFITDPKEGTVSLSMTPTIDRLEKGL